MFTLRILVIFLQLGFATSEENIYVDYDSNPDHPFPVIRQDVPSLKTNIIAESRETSYEFCGLKCAENRFCVAVNYKKQAAWNESNCQLTNSTARKFGNLSSEKERVWTFIKVNVDRSQVASCRGEVNECQNGGTMIWHPVKTFGCLCGKGYEGEICEKDIDECSNKLANECDINANCTNTAGSYNCQCRIGWSGKGKNCSDIDECSESNVTCHPNATCINTQGSYNCQCKNGHVGDGKENCTDSLLKSVILSGQLNDHRILRSWIGQTVTAKLCWRATRDGWATSTFHSKCDYKKPTVTIVKVGEFTFGGFATASWEGNNVNKAAPGSFIFSLRNKENLPPFKAPLKNPNDDNAVRAYSNDGPTFGRGTDLRIRDNAAFNTNSYTGFGTSYQPPPGVSSPSTILAGTFRITPSEVEVFYVV